MGGGIYCEGDIDYFVELYVSDCIINENRAVIEYTFCGGGGIFCHRAASLIIIGSHITDNLAIGTGDRQVGGGGIRCSEGPTNFIIRNSVISGNICRGEASPKGGGIFYELEYQYRSRLKTCLIVESIIKGNVAECTQPGSYNCSAGGGIYFYGVSPLITNCVLSRNSAAVGAGVCFDGCYPVVTNSIISGNTDLFKEKSSLYEAVGIYCSGAYANITNCTIIGNSGFGFFFSGGSANVINSIFYYNNKHEGVFADQIKYPSLVTVSYSDVQMPAPSTPPWPGIGNINADPCFVDSGYWDSNGTPYDYWDDFWVDGDYHLRPVSPCIDSGGPISVLLSDTDLDKKPRIVGAAVDMGAYETRLPAIEVKLFCTPRSINVHSHHKTVIAMLTMPDDIKTDDVDPNQPLFFEPCRVRSKRQMVYQQNWHGKSQTCVLAVFDLSGCMEKFSDGFNKVTVKSRLKTGRRYYGTDTLRVVSSNLPGWPF